MPNKLKIRHPNAAENRATKKHLIQILRKKQRQQVSSMDEASQDGTECRSDLWPKCTAEPEGMSSNSRHFA